MPFVTFTVGRGLSAADKSRLSKAMSEAQVAAGYHRADRFHRFLEVDRDDPNPAKSLSGPSTKSLSFISARPRSCCSRSVW